MNSVALAKARSKDRMRKKMIALAFDMQYHSPRTEGEKLMKPIAVCVKRINQWLMSSHSAVQIELNDLSHSQLCQVLTQFEQVHRAYQKQLNKILP